MKIKFTFAILIALLMATFKTSAAVFTAVGGDWNTSAAWTHTGVDSDNIPDADDNVTIGSGITVTVTAASQQCKGLAISSTGVLNFSAVDQFTIQGHISLDGTISGSFTGAGLIKAGVGGSGLAGAGTINITGNLVFNATETVAATITINITGTIKVGDNGTAGYVLGISGNVTAVGGVDGTMASSTLICNTGTTLTVENGVMSTSGNVISSAAYCANNNIIFSGSGSYNVGNVGNFENVTFTGGGTKTLSATIYTQISKSVLIVAGTTVKSSDIYDLNCRCDFNNNGTFIGGNYRFITIYKNYINNGTVSIPPTGGISCIGLTAETFSGSGTSNIGNLKMTTNVSRINTHNLIITGQLNVAAGSFENRSNLTVKAMTVAGSASFTTNSVGNFVTFTGAGAIPSTTSGYYNLTIAIPGGGGTKSLQSNTTVLNNFIMNPNNTLNSNNFDLTLKGNWGKNGIFLASPGHSVIFNGSSAQILTSGAATTTFSGLTINNINGVTFTSGAYILTEVLTINSGTFNTGGRPFTLASTATKTARIAPIGLSGFINGNFTIERFISSRDTTYADFASPVQSSTFLDWDNELPAISYVSHPPYTIASANTYNEATDAYVPVTSSGTALTPGQGFEVYLSGNFTYAPFPTTTMTTIGNPNQGDIDLTGMISNINQGWNLVGNPFASNISWASVYAASGSASSGLYDYIEMYDYTIGDWHGYTSSDAIEIGSSQGFWVYGLPAHVPVSLLIPESSKTSTSNSSIKSLNVSPYFSLNISSTDQSISYSHTFKVAATGDASNGLDNKDMPFRASPNKATPAMYSMLEGKKININTFNSSNDIYSIQLKTQVGVAGNYKIEAAGFDFLNEYTCIKLEDKLLNKTIDLTSQNVYSFSMSPTDNTDRFVVTFNKSNSCKSLPAKTSIASDFSNDIEILPTEQGNLINFNLSETTNSVISVINLLGQTIINPISVDANNQSINLALPEGFTGMYLVKIESTKGTVIKKFVRK